ncbi:MAG: penicillin acylase family protein [Spirochaetota bacterium]
MTKKTLVIIAGGIVAVILLAIGIYRFYFLPVSYQDTIVEGVSFPVAIYRLDKGYPLIVAENRDDAMFALGIVHAQDRLSQMEFLRSLATASSVQDGLSQYERIDRLVKAVGLPFKAKALLSELSPQYMQTLQKYVNGINTCKFKMSNSSKNKTHWNVEDIVCISLFLEFCNAFVTNTEFFFPVEDKDFPLLYRELTNKKIVHNYRKQDYPVIKEIQQLQELIASIFGLYGSYTRGFAVAIPSRIMYTDASTLCSSYEHSVSLYPLIYPVNFQVGGKVIEGYTWAGLPYVVAGKTNTLRYASFSLFADSQVFCKYQIQTRNNAQFYNSAIGYKELQCQPDSSHCVSRFTDSGPVISDAFEYNLKDAIVAISYISPGKGYVESMLDVAFANSIQDVIQIVQKYKGQPRVFVVQDDTRAYQIVTGTAMLDDEAVLVSPDKALLAKNAPGIFEIKQVDMCIAGSEFVENPSPALKRVMVFNNIGRLSSLYHELSHYNEIQYKDIEKILYSVAYPDAKEYLVIINNLLDKMPITSAKLAKVYFRDWDLNMRSNEVAPTLFNAIIAEMIQETFADELPYAVENMLIHFTIFEPEFQRLFKEDKSIYFDDIATIEKIESRDIIFDRAFLHSLKPFNYTIGPYIDEWKWGKVHSATLYHLDSGSLVKNVMVKKKTIAFDGCNATIYRSLSKQKNFSVDTVTVCCFYMDKIVHRLSLSTSITSNSASHYYNEFIAKDSFKDINLSKRNELFLIKPVKETQKQ